MLKIFFALLVWNGSAMALYISPRICTGKIVTVKFKPGSHYGEVFKNTTGIKLHPNLMDCRAEGYSELIRRWCGIWCQSENLTDLNVQLTIEGGRNCKNNEELIKNIGPVTVDVTYHYFEKIALKPTSTLVVETQIPCVEY